MTISASAPSRRRLHKALFATIAACTGVVGLASAAQAASGPPSAARVNTRAQVPWQSVGSGWSVATWVANPAAKHARATVFLISPSGDRYAITKVPQTAYAESWSPDGRTLLLSGYRREIKLNLRTGERTRVAVPGAVLGFTRDSRSLITEVYRGQTDRIERFDLLGHRLHVYPARVRGAGGLNSWRAVPLAGGRLAIGAKHGVVLFGRHGRVLGLPASHLNNCSVESTWGKGMVVARCNRGALWTIPISRGSVRRITDSQSKENPFGYDRAWRYSAGRLGLAENGCGPDTLVRFTAAGHGRRIYPPAPIKKQGVAAYVGHHGDIVDMMFVQGCAGGEATLFAYDAVANTSTALLGPGVNAGSVTSVAPWVSDE